MATAFQRLRFVTRIAASRAPLLLRQRPAPSSHVSLQPRYIRTTTLRLTENRPDDGEPIGPFPAAGGGVPLEDNEELEDEDEDGEAGEIVAEDGDEEDDDVAVELEELEEELADLDVLDEDEDDLDELDDEDEEGEFGIFEENGGGNEDLQGGEDVEGLEGGEEGDEERRAHGMHSLSRDGDRRANSVRHEYDPDDVEPDEEDDDDMFELEGDVDEDQEEPPWPQNFWSMDEERDDPGEELEFERDDITSLAHGELEQHRELREFARVMAWDMPLLYNQARAFEPPTAAQPLRFRYTTYMGEAHPAARKVVLTFTPTSLPDLNPIQASKLIKLLGVRYNPSTSTAKMSCELYPTVAQNKRYLGDLLDKLLHECRTGADNLSDMPFDFRHHKPKVRHLFPEAWKLTAERRQALQQRREQLRIGEEEALAAGRLVEGYRVADELRAVRSPVTSEREAVMQVASAKVAGQKSGTQQRRASRAR